MGEVCMVPDGLRCCLGQRMVLLRPNYTICDGRFLLYAIQSPRVQHQIAWSEGTGSTVSNLRIPHLEALRISTPPLGEQVAIADVLGGLDDKIEQNRRTGRALEELARATFKAWFVDFEPVKAKAAGAAGFPGMPPTAFADLPDRLTDSALGPVPEGWEVMPATAVAAVAIGKTPPRKEPHWFSTDPSNVRWVSIANMGSCGVFIRDTSEYLTAEAVERFNIRRIPADSVLYSFKLTMGRVAITDGEMTSNEAIAHFIPLAPDRLGSEYLYCYLVGFDHARLGSTSSIATATNSKAVKQMPVLVPTAELAEGFTRTVRPLFEMIRTLTRESAKLAALRDYLLPRLLSGRVRVNPSQKDAEA